MQALRLHPDRQLRLHDDEPVPDPGPGEALVQVTAVGLCGSDRHWLMDGGIGDAVLDRPLILGHEFAGIALTGALKDRHVAVDPAVSCDACAPCRAGASNLCLNIQFAGHGRTDGALRDYLAWPETSLSPLPDHVTDAEGALVEPLSVAIHAMDLGGLEPGGTAAVIGCGPIGLLVVALCRMAGAGRIVASDPQRHRLDAAAAMGATETIVATGSADDGAAVAASSRGGAEVVFEASGEAAAVECAVVAARPGGQVVLLGIPPDDRTSFTASVARRKGLTLRLSRRSTPETFRRAVVVAAAHSIDLQSLVTLRVPLPEGAAAFDSLVRRDGIKVIVEPGG